MKMRLLIALVGLAIGFVLPAFAQQKDTVDPQIRQQIDAIDKKLDEAFSENNASAVAALFTEDAILVAPDGIFVGRQAIEKRYADTFQRWPFTNFSVQRDQLNAIDNAAWSVGEWTTNANSQPGHGYRTLVYTRDGDTWKIRVIVAMYLY